MANWEWLDEPGNVGELPVKILENEQAEFLLDFAEGTRVGSYTLATGRDLSPGDVCILNAEIDAVSKRDGQTVLDITVFDVETIRESDETSSASQGKPERSDEPDSAVQSMMRHLEAARNRQIERKNSDRCPNCRTVNGSTDVTLEERTSGRDLHYCEKCGRLLSTREYQRWKDEHTW